VNFWEHFLRLLPSRPKPALAALYWHLTRRRVRASNRLRVASADLPFAYEVWIGLNERTVELANDWRAAMAQWNWNPRFSIFLHSEEACSGEQLERSLLSIRRQIYSSWTLVDSEPLDVGLGVERSKCDYIVPLRVGDELSKTALFRLAEAAQANCGAALFYGDEDQLDEIGGRTGPWFKPQWNEEMFLALDYLSSCVAIESCIARTAAASKQAEDLPAFVLAATAAAAGRIIHVPHVLCHVEQRQKPDSARLTAVAKHVRPLGATCTFGTFGTVKIKWPLPENLPLVSIIIPTKDKVELLRACIYSVLGRTTYESFEILIVDNESVEAETLEFLREMQAQPAVRILSYPHAFNFSALNNFAARHARGSHLCLLNNDTEVLDPDWLSEMMRYSVRPEIGAVGAKLLYRDGSIQHAGVVVGLGDAAGHAHRFLDSRKPGYFLMPHVAQSVSAVTAACMIVEKAKFEQVGGFSDAFVVAFNDVDFCLKLQAAGWRNVYVPHAVLVHHESKSRGNDISPGNIERYRRELKLLQERWGTKTYQDPLHNPNLDRFSETFVLRL
jgi:GT2 family glycosyltransferase